MSPAIPGSLLMDSQEQRRGNKRNRHSSSLRQLDADHRAHAGVELREVDAEGLPGQTEHEVEAHSVETKSPQQMEGLFDLGGVVFAPEQLEQVVRVVQESLTNVSNYAMKLEIIHSMIQKKDNYVFRVAYHM